MRTKDWNSNRERKKQQRYSRLLKMIIRLWSHLGGVEDPVTNRPKKKKRKRWRIFFPVVRIVAVLRPTEKNTSDRSKANSKNSQVEKKDRNERKWRKSPLLYEWWQGVLLTLVSSEWRGAIKQVSHLSIREKRIVKLDAVDNFPFSLSADSSSSSTARENEIEGKLFFPSKQPVTIGSAVRQLSAWAGRKREKWGGGGDWIAVKDRSYKQTFALLCCSLINRPRPQLPHRLLVNVHFCIFSSRGSGFFPVTWNSNVTWALFFDSVGHVFSLSLYNTSHPSSLLLLWLRRRRRQKKNEHFFPSVGREFDTPTRLPTFSCRFPGDFFFIWKRESWLSLKTWHFSSERFLLLYRKMSRSCDLWT